MSWETISPKFPCLFGVRANIIGENVILSGGKKQEDEMMTEPAPIIHYNPIKDDVKSICPPNLPILDGHATCIILQSRKLIISGGNKNMTNKLYEYMPGI